MRDIKPSIETIIGYIETYSDPLSVRAEFEGIVSMVNKERSAAYSKLVAQASNIIDHFPWDKKIYESQIFEPPDFTGLDIVAFGSSNVPIGINLPNYEDIH